MVWASLFRFQNAIKLPGQLINGVPHRIQLNTLKSKPEAKVFGVGIHKTATSSLDRALKMLGYRSTHWDKHEAFLKALLSGCEDDLKQAMCDFDAASDLPIPLMIPELDAQFPGSKFILTVRNPETLVASVENHIRQRRLVIEEYLLYGLWRFDRKRCLERYEQHTEYVLEYFRGRPADLLVLDIAGGEGWAKVCPFLGKPIPDSPFPHIFKGKYPK